MDNGLDRAYVYDAAMQLYKLNRNNKYIKQMMKEIEPEFFFNVLDVLVDIIKRQEKEIDEYEQGIIEIEED